VSPSSKNKQRPNNLEEQKVTLNLQSISSKKQPSAKPAHRRGEKEFFSPSFDGDIIGSAQAAAVNSRQQARHQQMQSNYASAGHRA